MKTGTASAHLTTDDGSVTPSSGLDSEVSSFPQTIIVADDHPIIRDALVALLEKRFRGATVMVACDYTELSSLVLRGPKQLLVVTDLVMPGMSGLDSLRKLCDLAPAAQVIVQSSNAEQSIAEACLRVGARAFVGKRATTGVIDEVIDIVMEGRTTIVLGDKPSSVPKALVDRTALVEQLTPQQVRVFQMLGDGLLNKQIAYSLGISEATVKAHVSKILDTLRCNSRNQAATCASWMTEHGLI
ncbi:response regulator transcription factor [Mongoliimonas terrestris]|uniref:response regulator transcription factor n=1 Tax=Mongoliimonas terrestris TaxID=1709001 RepID=UPI0009F82CB6|nr:response regulator transcription factor [Mongoliimonas terrestris]